MNSLARHLLIATVTILSLAGVRPACELAAQEPTPADPASRNAAWRIADADCTFRVNTHRRVHVEKAGQEIETVRITAGNGTYVRVATAVEPVRIVDETEISVPIKSDRRRLQVLARVVLPRSKDPHTGGPITVLVRGELYRDLKNWQRLVLRDLPRKRDEAARALRLQLDAKIDVRESYVDLLCLNVYGGRGTTTVEIATPEVDEVPQQTRLPDAVEISTKTRGLPKVTSKRRPQRIHAASSARVSSAGVSSGDIQQVNHDALLPSNETTVKTDGSLFFVDGRPTFVRMIDHRGEDLVFLRQLGFNTVRLNHLATESEIDAASRNNLWIVCPPPEPTQVQVQSGAYRRVIAWDVGERLVTEDLERVVARINEMRGNELLPPLPILGSADSDLYAFSSHLDVMVHHREPVGTALPLNRYASWLENRPHLCSPAALHWAAIQTESLESLQRQWRAFQYPGGRVPIEPSQLRHLAFAAVGAGMRGLHFRSRTPLNAGTSSARARASMLRLVNLELDRIEPWAIAGKKVGAANCDLPGSTTFVLQTQRGQLLCLLQGDENEQYVPSTPETLARVTVPGVPATSEVYQLIDSGVKTLTTKRVAGGSRIELEQLDTPTFVVMTQNPIVVNSVSRGVIQRLPQISMLRQELARDSHDRARLVAEELASHGIRIPSVSQSLHRAESLLQQAAVAAADKQYSVVGDLARKASNAVSTANRALWERSNRAVPTAVASPLCTQLSTLPWHWHLVRHLPAAKGIFNLLPTGNFEQEQLTGWRSLQHAPKDVSVQVSRNIGQAYSGEACLRIAAFANTAAASQSTMESPLIWVNSPSIPVRGNQVVKISGMVKVTQPIAGSSDGVLIFDSFGGAELGYRILETDDWQPFVFYRASEHKRPVSLTVALTGLGEVLIDKVIVSPVVDLNSQNRAPVETLGGRSVPSATK